MQNKPDKSLIWLGKYLSLALTLPACVAAGYFLGALLDNWLRFAFFKVVGIVLGMAAGLIQILRELSRETRPPGTPK
jgi:F0F1-type ATP synthase assembly protein I